MSKFKIARKKYHGSGNASTEEVEVEADAIDIEHGHLAVRDHDANIVAIFAPGEWISSVKDK